MKIARINYKNLTIAILLIFLTTLTLFFLRKDYAYKSTRILIDELDEEENYYKNKRESLKKNEIGVKDFFIENKSTISKDNSFEKDVTGADSVENGDVSVESKEQEEFNNLKIKGDVKIVENWGSTVLA